jgi:hypothetical protein
VGAAAADTTACLQIAADHGGQEQGQEEPGEHPHCCLAIHEPVGFRWTAVGLAVAPSPWEAL